MESRKRVLMKLFAGQQQTQTENRLVDSNGETDRKSRLMDSGVGRKERGLFQKHVKYFRREWTHCSHTGKTYRFVLKRYSFLLQGMLC